MNKVMLILFLMLACGEIVRADTIDDARDWYLNEYAPLWSDPDPENFAKLERFYSESRIWQPLSGKVKVRGNTDHWRRSSLEYYHDLGWHDGQVDIEVKSINDATVLIHTLWRYKDANNDVMLYCDHAIAARQLEGWQFLMFAECIP